jgi:hypothetical protein
MPHQPHQNVIFLNTQRKGKWRKSGKGKKGGKGEKRGKGEKSGKGKKVERKKSTLTFSAGRLIPCACCMGHLLSALVTITSLTKLNFLSVSFGLMCSLLFVLPPCQSPLTKN